MDGGFDLKSMASEKEVDIESFVSPDLQIKESVALAGADLKRGDLLFVLPAFISIKVSKQKARENLEHSPAIIEQLHQTLLCKIKKNIFKHQLFSSYLSSPPKI